ncbi:unnamed protein product [Clonostachys solani]|uniref:Uncharacterized protein n=1 Tax=Clonostachys solani TaxID=160281 RepID=A0A9N9ZME9_9HYPO|nr:unnamed protein product [Clonostachys solani]
MSHKRKPTGEKARSFNRPFLFLVLASFVFFFIGRYSATGNGQDEVQSHEHGPLKTLCYMSRNLQRHPDFFSALGLDPFSSEFLKFRQGMGTDEMVENVLMDAYVRIRMEDIRYNPDMLTATEALLDKHRMSAYLGWVKNLGAQGWKVNWEMQCAGI